MNVQPISLSTANALVYAMHRHSRPVIGHLFSLGLFGDDLTLHGAAIVGRPVARRLDDGSTVEITRNVTDGVRNGCSMLYGAACREAKRRGYARAITYTLASETGASLRAAGFIQAAASPGRSWDVPSRPRKRTETQPRWRWERDLTNRKELAA